MRIGCSGWYYDHWQGVLYPLGVDKARYFEFYSKEFNTVEINSTFYRMPFRGYVLGWIRKAPKGFKYSVKMNRRITHEKRLRNVEYDLNDFISRIEPMRKAGKLAIILIQLPPGLHYDIELLNRFLELLPEGYRYSIEFRHKSWFKDKVYETLSDHDVAFCIVSAPRLPSVLRKTSDTVYVRFHGVDGWYNYEYSSKELEDWAEALININPKHLYIYFNNDPHGYAVKNAREMKKIIDKLTLQLC